MIPTIGFMMGAYIITRMFDVMARGERPHPVVLGAAVLTVLIALTGMFELYSAASSSTDALNSIPSWP